jgi:hypothetical protein
VNKYIGQQTNFQQSMIAYLFFFTDPLVTDLKIDCFVGFGCCVLCIVASIGAAEMQAEEN